MRAPAAILTFALVVVSAAVAVADEPAAPAAPATTASTPGTLQVPTGAFFGTISGTVQWPATSAALGKPKDRAKACSKITVRALKQDPSAPGGVVELRSVQAKGGPYPAKCTFSLPGIRIRQDVVVEATYPAEEWSGCASTTFVSAPAKGGNWKNPVQLQKSGEVKRPLALAVTCKKK